MPRLILPVVLFSCAFPRVSLPQEPAPRPPANKVWTDDDLRSSSNASSATEEPASTGNSTPRNHYLRAKDPKWYAKQLGPLREEIDQIDRQLKAILQARKDGRGTTGAVALDKGPEGVTTESETVLLQKRRAVLVRKIDELESEARRDEISPGDLRSDFMAEKNQPGEAADDSVLPEDPAEIARAKNSLREAKEHLKRARNELNLLQRRLDLEQRQIYSKPDYLSRKSGESRLASIQADIKGKQQETQQTEDEIGRLEDRLEDLKLTQPAEAASRPSSEREGAARESNPCRPTETAIACTVSEKAQEEKGETYWRNRFAEVRYKIRIAENERDILQRELSVLLVQYYPNPGKAMRESITRKEINEHQKAIEDKQREIRDLRHSFSDLEDELRHASGDAAWSRE